jgi:hypothetical protein
MLCQSLWPQVRIPSFTFMCLLCFLLYFSYVQTSKGLWISGHKIGMREHSYYCRYTVISLEMHFHACISLRSFDLSPTHLPLRFTVYTLVQLNHWYHGKLCTFVLWQTKPWNDALPETCRIVGGKSLIGWRKCVACGNCWTDRSNWTNQSTVPHIRN